MGFLVISSRTVEHMGNDRTAELAFLYQTQLAGGRLAFKRSLGTLLDFVGNLQFELNYPI
jgi:hypothetical protein